METELETLDRIEGEIAAFRDHFAELIERGVDRMTNEQSKQLLFAQQRTGAMEDDRDLQVARLEKCALRVRELERDLADALDRERMADQRADGFHDSWQMAVSEVNAKDERIRILATDLRLSENARRAAEQIVKTLRVKEVQAESLVVPIQYINDVMTRVSEALLGAGSGIKAGAEVRRQMAVKYTLEHEAEHGAQAFDDAAYALIGGDSGGWPEGWDLDTFIDLVKHPQKARAHEIALLAVAYDITRKEQDEDG